MAEGYDSDGKSKDGVLEEHLKCPICFDIFRSPRALSCLHTFCEACLSAHILKSDNYGTIDCPTCRQETRVTENRKPKSEWSKSLPLNYTILPLIETLAVGKSCEGSGKSSEKECTATCVSCASSLKLSASYCLNCNGTICVACADLHRKLRVFEKHVVHHFTDDGTPKKCDKHEAKELEFFCEFHKIAVCSTCAVSEHRKCSNVTEIKEDIVKQTIQTKANEMDERVKLLQDKTSKIVENFEKLTEEFDKNTSIVREQFQGYNETCSERTKVQQHTLLQSKMLITKIKSIASLLSACKLSPTKQCMFVVLQNIASDIDKLEQEFATFQSLDTNEWNSSDLIENLVKSTAQQFKLKIDTNHNPGEPEVEGATYCRPSSEFQKEESSFVEAQIAENRVFAKDVKWKFVRSNSLQKGNKNLAPWYFGMVHIRGGNLAAIDNQNHELVFVNSSGKVKDMLPLEGNPLGITLVHESCVAVIFEDMKIIQLFYISDFEGEAEFLFKVDVIQLDFFPEAIAHTSFGFTVVGDGVIVNVDEKGSKLKEITFDLTDLNVRKCISKCILVNEAVSMMYISDQETNTLSVISIGGKAEKKPFYRVKKVKTPGGLDFDTDNNVYVCSERENSVLVFTYYGDMITEIPVINCRSPSTIAFNSQRDMFWVTNKDSPEVMKEFLITHYLF